MPRPKGIVLIGRREFLRGGFGLLSFCALSRVSRALSFAGDLSSTASATDITPSDRIEEIYQGLNLYWGDIHGHTGFSDGYGLPDEYYQRARYDQKLHFAALSDHAEWIKSIQSLINMNDGTPIPLWDFTIESADLNYFPGEFVPLVGFEWTSNLYGHRNVYFNDTSNVPPEPLDCEAFRTPEELWQALEPYDALTIPHHPIRNVALTDWEYFNPNERLVEIFSKWGNAERAMTTYEPYLFYRKHPDMREIARGHAAFDMLTRGYKIGIIAGSDSHQGLAGSTKIDSPRGIPLGHSLFEGVTGEEFLQLLSEGYTYDHREPHGGGGGLSAVWASNLERDLIWRALYNRHTYATTGSRPIIRFAVQDSSDAENTAIMGEEISVGGIPLFLISVQSESGSRFERAELWKNGVKIASSRKPVENATFMFEDPNFQSHCGTYYVVRCVINQYVAYNSDNDKILKYDETKGFFESEDPQLEEIAWTSPIWVD